MKSRKSSVRFSKRRTHKKTDKATKALSMVKALRKRIELKINDQPNYTTALTTVFATNSLMQIAGGTSDTTRIGSHITVKKIVLSCLFTMGSNPVTKGNKVRMLVLQDLQQIDSNDPNVGNIFVNGSDWQSNYNLAQIEKRFKIYYDKVIDFRPYQVFDSTAGKLTTLEHSIFKRVVIRPKGKYQQVGYSGTTVGSVNQNGFYLVLASQYGSTANVSQGIVPLIETQVHFNDD